MNSRLANSFQIQVRVSALDRLLGFHLHRERQLCLKKGFARKAWAENIRHWLCFLQQLLMLLELSLNAPRESCVLDETRAQELQQRHATEVQTRRPQLRQMGQQRPLRRPVDWRLGDWDQQLSVMLGLLLVSWEKSRLCSISSHSVVELAV